MAVDPILFVENLLHVDYDATTVTASSEADGYPLGNAREGDLVKAWKPDDGSGDEYLMFDFGSTTALGTSGQTGYLCLAYDARGSGQSQFVLSTSITDTSGGAFTQNKLVVTVDDSGIICYKGSFTMSEKRYYRLYQWASARTGTVTSKFLYVGMYGASNIIDIGGAGYPGDKQAEYSISTVDRQGVAITSSLARMTSAICVSGQKFEVSMQPAKASTWEAMRDAFYASFGVGTPIFVQFEGLYSAGSSSDFFLCQLEKQERDAQVADLDKYGIKVSMETVPWI